jgi:uncharacterized protein YecE (DUF72 family)
MDEPQVRRDAASVQGTGPSRIRFLVGTASWTDPSLVKSDTFYPSYIRTAEDRLRFYASHFGTVEVDSSYYALLSEKNSRLWAERTPSGFVFNVKAFAMLTQHPAEVARLPTAIKEMLTPAQRAEARLKKPPREILDLAFQMFGSALGPLREAEKMGMVLFQFPPYFVRRTSNLDYLAALPDRLPDTPIAIEFRHPSWVAEGRARKETMSFLREHGLTYVAVDAPVMPSTIPPFLAATGPEAYVRFHGRNRETWFKRGIEPSERYKYLYSEGELAEWAGWLKKFKGVRRAFVIFNNCYRNFGIMNATTMTQMLAH